MKLKQIYLQLLTYNYLLFDIYIANVYLNTHAYMKRELTTLKTRSKYRALVVERNYRHMWTITCSQVILDYYIATNNLALKLLLLLH